MTNLRRRFSWPAAAVVAVLLAVPDACRAAGPNDWDLQFIRRLRAQRLTWLAVNVARRRSAQADSARAAAPWVVELVRSLAGEAMEGVGREDPNAEQAWKQVALAERDFEKRFPRSPWRLQVRLQVALAHVARARALQLEAMTGDTAQGGREEALRQIRSVRRMLRDLIEELDRADTARQGDSMPSYVVQSLQNQAALAEVKLLSWRGALYKEGSNDRIAAFNAALQRIDDILAGTQPSDVLRSEALLLRATALRQLGDVRRAAATLDVVRKQKGLPGPLRLRIDAERLRAARAAGKGPGEWPVAPRIGRTIAGESDVDWDMTSLELLLEDASPTRGADAQRMRDIEQGVESIAQRYGPYWGRRAGQLVARYIARSGGSGSGALLVKSAMERRREGNRAAAIELLEQAAEAFRKTGDSRRAFDSLYQAALIAREAKQYRTAADRLRDLSLDLRDDSRASAAHLLAIWCLRKTESDPQEKDRQYLVWLDEQLAVWPKAKATQRARWWMGQWLAGRKRYLEALSAYAGIDPTSELRRSANRAAWRLWWTLLDASPPPHKKKRVAEAAEYFGRIAARCTEAGVPDAACEAGVMQVAFVSLQRTEVPPRTLEQLDRAQNTPAEAKDGDLCRVEAEWVRANLIPTATFPPESVRGLGFLWYRWAVERWRLAHRSGDRAEAVDGDALVKLLGRLESDDPAPSARRIRRWSRLARAEILAASGKEADAKSLLEPLVRESPRDYQVQRAWAERLLQSKNPVDWPRAEQAWRRLAARTRPDTPAWYEAKYGVARSLFQQGKRTEALQRIRYLETTRGPLPEPWRARFEVLGKECKTGR